MNFLKRAWLTLIAKKGRTLLLILVTSAILLFVLAGILIKNAANTATDNAKKSVGATLTLSANREAAFKKMRQASQSDTSQSETSQTSRPKLTMAAVKLADVKQIAALSGVQSYQVQVNTSVNAKSLTAISTSSDSNMPAGGPGGQESSQGDLTINGVSATNSLSSFTSGSNKITKGRGITASDLNTNNVVIESELAKENDLSVGDTFTVKNTSGSKTYTLKIVGIYKATSMSTQAGPGQSDPANTLYTAYTFANTVKGKKYKQTADSVTFTISDPAKVSQVKKAGQKLINTSKYSLSADDANYQQVKASMANIKSFANKIVWLVALAGTIILALIVILMIRERRYEIGVLLSLGESRLKIIAQFFTEMLVVLLISLGIAGLGGQFVGNKLGEQLITQQTSQTTTTTTNQNGGPGGGGPSGQAPGQKGPSGPNGSSSTPTKAEKAQLNVQITGTDLLELGGLGLVIIFASISVASGGILRLQPRKVLIDN